MDGHHEWLLELARLFCFWLCACLLTQPGKRSANCAAMPDHSPGILLANSVFTHKIVEGNNHTKTDIVVPVVRVVVVADRDTRVVFIVVPRAATQTL